MTLLAPSQLLLPAGDCKHARRLVLASREWLDLQARVEALLALPPTQDAMQARYGRAAAVTQSKDLFGTIASLRHAASGFGSPARLRANVQDGRGQDWPDRPAGEAFAAALWTIGRAGRDAQDLSTAFGGLAGASEQRQANDTVAWIRSRFLDPGQVVESMERTVIHLSALMARFHALDLELDGLLQKARLHTAANSRTRKWLDAEIGTLSSILVLWEQHRSDACLRWLDLSLAAGIVPAVLRFAGACPAVVLSTPTGQHCFTTAPATTDGVAAIAAGALATTSGLARSAYNSLADDVDDSDDFVAQCAYYRADIGALEHAAQHWHAAAAGVIAQLRTVRDAWAGAARDLVARVGALRAGNLGDGPWLKPGPMAAAADSWSALAEAAGAFVHGALLEARALGFGDLLPRDDPRWQLRFAARAAA